MARSSMLSNHSGRGSPANPGWIGVRTYVRLDSCIGYIGHTFAKLTTRSFITFLFFFVKWYLYESMAKRIIFCQKISLQKPIQCYITERKIVSEAVCKVL